MKYINSSKGLPMTMRILSVLAISLMALSQGEAAIETGESTSRKASETEAKTRKAFSLDVGLSSSYFDYREDLPAPKKSTESGSVLGVVIGGQGYLSHSPHAAVLRGKIDIGQSKTAYDGALQSNQGAYLGPYSGSTNNSFFNLEGLISGYFTSFNNDRSELRGYSGLGLKSWTREMVGDYANTEVYSWTYLPLGLRLENQLSEKFSLTVDASLRMMLAGSVKLQLAKNTIYDDTEVTLGTTIGTRLELPLAYKLTQTVKLMASPWVEWSSFGQSNTTELTAQGRRTSIGVVEPASKTVQYGGVLGISADI